MFLENTKKILRDKKDEILTLGKKIQSVNKLVAEKRSKFARLKKINMILIWKDWILFLR